MTLSEALLVVAKRFREHEAACREYGYYDTEYCEEWSKKCSE